MKTKTGRIIKLVIFLAIIGVIFWGLTALLVKPLEGQQSKRLEGLYTEEENTWDAAFIGTSSVYYGWASPLCYEKSGYAIYPVASPSMHFMYVKNMMEETEKRQNVDLFIIDIRGMRTVERGIDDANIRYITDTLHDSANRLDALSRTYNYVSVKGEDGTITDDTLSYYLPLFKYHDRWSQLTEDDYVQSHAKYKGYKLYGSAFSVNEFEEPEDVTTSSKLTDMQKKLIDELLDYIKENNYKVLFVNTPAVNDKDEKELFNGVLDYLEEKGYDTLNLDTSSMYKTMNLDFSTDFYESIHLNCRGAAKVTEYITEYLQKNYNLTDHRGDEKYIKWQRAADKYDEKIITGWEEKQDMNED